MAIYSMSMSVCTAGGGASASIDYVLREKAYAKKIAELESSKVYLYNSQTTSSQDFVAYVKAQEQALKSGQTRVLDKHIVALPREFTPAQRLAVCEQYIANLEITSNRTLSNYIIAVHNDPTNNNPHAHIAFVARDVDGLQIRPLTAHQIDKKIADRFGLDKSFLKQKSTDLCRRAWADTVNHYAKTVGIDIKIDHRSLKDQGLEQLPTIHEGFKNKAGFESKVSHNQTIIDHNELLQEIKKTTLELDQALEAQEAKEATQRTVAAEKVSLEAVEIQKARIDAQEAQKRLRQEKDGRTTERLSDLVKQAERNVASVDNCTKRAERNTDVSKQVDEMAKQNFENTERATGSAERAVGSASSQNHEFRGIAELAKSNFENTERATGSASRQDRDLEGAIDLAERAASSQNHELGRIVELAKSNAELAGRKNTGIGELVKQAERANSKLGRCAKDTRSQHEFFSRLPQVFQSAVEQMGSIAERTIKQFRDYAEWAFKRVEEVSKVIARLLQDQLTNKPVAQKQPPPQKSTKTSAQIINDLIKLRNDILTGINAPHHR